jgi:glyoxylase-like metal-dependent hydrolase (beta-lactamase superfamily II)
MIQPGNLAVTWHAGWPSPKHDTAPEIQAHSYDERTIILRQNKSVHFEAPFLFLLRGIDRALLVDTGATEDARYFPLRRTVDSIIGEHHELLVVHTHGHGDHRAADAQFADRPNTTVVGTPLDDVIAHYGFVDWPNTRSTIDLGGRVVDVIPGPGHHAAATVFYDRATGLLLTGDTVYPGRLYVQDWQAFTATIDRLLAFAEEHPVTHVLGCHIEMSTTPGQDYYPGCTHQPDEPPLQLTVGHLRAVRAAIDTIGDRRGVHPFDEFVIHRND